MHSYVVTKEVGKIATQTTCFDSRTDIRTNTNIAAADPGILEQWIETTL
jgi:hypothetical protein